MFSLGFILTFAAAANNDYSVTVGDHTIHYNTFNSSTLQPNIAKAFGIPRSNKIAVLNVVVKKGRKDSAQASVSATATNLNGQMRTINMRKVIDGSAIYYIGDFRFSNEETLKFNIKVTPQGQDRATEIKFSRQFFPG
ncbi:MAG: hypothetical protein BMS9Abin26_0242 [Gammaproteobacteria bacterium]|nr:MAG: hypothetical protein BMS9Abin26_0242 [Gammaproteobacteria bacterium]